MYYAFAFTSSGGTIKVDVEHYLYGTFGDGHYKGCKSKGHYVNYSFDLQSHVLHPEVEQTLFREEEQYYTYTGTEL